MIFKILKIYILILKFYLKMVVFLKDINKFKYFYMKLLKDIWF